MQVFNPAPNVRTLYDLLTPKARALANLCVRAHTPREKIQCIRAFRDVATCSLVDAKNAIEAAIDRGHWHL